MGIKEKIGSRIKEIRTKKGLTQEELAESMGINPKYLSSIERGRENPTLNTLISLSESLGVPLEEIFDFTGEEKPSRISARISALVSDANDDQLKLILRLISVIVH